MDVQNKLDEIVEAIGSARSMPMSASCVVNRADLLDMLEEVRQALPNSLAHAQELIGGREQMVEQARQEATRIIESAQAQRGDLISDTEVARRSQAEADRILAEARQEADEIRAEADEYVDSKLANFEVVLTKTIGSVGRGREKLLGRGPGLDEQGYSDEDAPDYSPDPATLLGRADEYVDTKLGAFEAVLAKTLEAVGKGRQKLHGRVASDDLGLHMAEQDGLDHSQLRGSDADFLADLAEPQPAAPLRTPEPPRLQPQVPAQQPYDPYAAQYGQQPQPPQQDPYAASYGQQPDPYGYQQDPYAASYAQHGAVHGEQQGYDQYGRPAQQQPQQQPQQSHQQQGSLDETSMFDTSMINLDQLREYEQGR
ncbi:ATP synthase F0 subunit B [Streptomyces sp. NBC_00237]|uniref:ATP synthase F0 subunit B n=1 Tax=Streptomyces sp. NBC_00237 TaxID=2975687 RepID=UPI00225C3CA8|nr:ATP synthase F0 subunit B [Streptomyces sp. NBC_00237]MCX5203959.1 ATP synthase F0 subunit B [Streptomyces sp. NBC_00237]